MNALAQLRLLWKLRPLFKRGKELAGMKITTQGAVQFILVLIQALNLLQAAAAPKTQITIGCIVALLQALVGLVNHCFNTNGTPQELPGGAAAPVDNYKVKGSF